MISIRKEIIYGQAIKQNINALDTWNPKWFQGLLDETDFPDPPRLGERGPVFKYPEWLIMFIAILSVKLKVKSYLQIHKMAVKYWPVIAQGMDLTPISERQLRERLKKIRHFPGKPAAFIFQLFPELE